MDRRPKYLGLCSNYNWGTPVLDSVDHRRLRAAANGCVQHENESKRLRAAADRNTRNGVRLSHARVDGPIPPYQCRFRASRIVRARAWRTVRILNNDTNS